LYKNCGRWKKFDCIFGFSVKSYVRNTINLSWDKILLTSVIGFSNCITVSRGYLCCSGNIGVSCYCPYERSGEYWSRCICDFMVLTGLSTCRRASLHCVTADTWSWCVSGTDRGPSGLSWSDVVLRQSTVSETALSLPSCKHSMYQISEFATTMSIYITLFWRMAPCRLIRINHYFRGGCCQRLQGTQQKVLTNKR
jgi:hypothetical protein